MDKTRRHVKGTLLHALSMGDPRCPMLLMLVFVVPDFENLHDRLPNRRLDQPAQSPAPVFRETVELVLPQQIR